MAPDIEAVTKLLQEEKVSKPQFAQTSRDKNFYLKFVVKFGRVLETLPQTE